MQTLFLQQAVSIIRRTSGGDPSKLNVSTESLEKMSHGFLTMSDLNQMDPTRLASIARLLGLSPQEGSSLKELVAYELGLVSKPPHLSVS